MKNIKTIIYFSTRSIYGEIHEKEVFEENAIFNPRKYGATKRIAEQIFSEADDLNTIGFRLPGIVGAGAHDIWLKKTVDKIRKNEDVTISNFETKNFAYIDDIAKFTEGLILESLNGRNFKYKIVNISCAEKINNLEIAKTIKDRLKSSSQIISVKPSEGLFLLNSDKAQDMGFVSSTPLEIVNHYLDYVLGD